MNTSMPLILNTEENEAGEENNNNAIVNIYPDNDEVF